MASVSTQSEIFDVQLEVEGCQYTARVWRADPDRWVLISVQVTGGAAIAPAENQRSSCLEILFYAESIASQFVADAMGKSSKGELATEA